MAQSKGLGLVHTCSSVKRRERGVE